MTVTVLGATLHDEVEDEDEEVPTAATDTLLDVVEVVDGCEYEKNEVVEEEDELVWAAATVVEDEVELVEGVENVELVDEVDNAAADTMAVLVLLTITVLT